MSTDGDDGQTELETSGNADISTADTMRERAGENRLKLLILLKANRLYVTVTLSLVVFVSFIVIGDTFFSSFLSDVRSQDTIETLFSTMLGAIITGTTLVVTISQLVLSQENGPLGDQHERMSNTMNVREYIRDVIGQPAPADPSAFLRELIEETAECSSALRESVSGSEETDLKDEVDEFTDSLQGNADEVQRELEGATFGEFDVLYSALDFNYTYKIFQVERIEYEYADSLSDDQHELFGSLRTALSMFGPAREHIKTLYFQWALIDLSQLIVYASVPALVVAGGMLTFVGPASFPGFTFGVANVVWVVGAAFTVTVIPFLLLLSYIVRIVTVAKRTLAIGPLILRDSQR